MSSSLPQQHTSKGLLGSSLIVASMTMLSRVLGLVRDIVIASMFGAGSHADAFFVALKFLTFYAACLPKAGRIGRLSALMKLKVRSMVTFLMDTSLYQDQRLQTTFTSNFPAQPCLYKPSFLLKDQVDLSQRT